MTEMTDAALRQQLAQWTRKALGELVEDEALAAPIVTSGFWDGKHGQLVIAG